MEYVVPCRSLHHEFMNRALGWNHFRCGRLVWAGIRDIRVDWKDGIFSVLELTFLGHKVLNPPR